MLCGLNFRNRYDNRLWILFLYGLTNDPVACGGKEETAPLIGVHIASDVVIVITGRIVNFASVVIVVGTVFVNDFGFRFFRAS